MKKTIGVPSTTEKLISVTCDICKATYLADDFLEVQEFHHIKFVGGYGSVFGDEHSVECDACQHCLYRMIGEYATIIDLMHFDEMVASGMVE